MNEEKFQAGAIDASKREVTHGIMPDHVMKSLGLRYSKDNRDYKEFMMMEMNKRQQLERFRTDMGTGLIKKQQLREEDRQAMESRHNANKKIVDSESNSDSDSGSDCDSSDSIFDHVDKVTKLSPENRKREFDSNSGDNNSKQINVSSKQFDLLRKICEFETVKRNLSDLSIEFNETNLSLIITIINELVNNNVVSMNEKVEIIKITNQMKN
jgi:hypothetical protein